MRRFNRSVLVIAALAQACGPMNMQPDGGDNDVVTRDNANPDVVLRPDMGTPDMGTPDTGTPDTGTPDAGHADVVAPDAAPTDVATPDATAPDSGPTDGGACAHWNDPPTVDPSIAVPPPGSADAGTDASVADAGTYTVLLHVAATGTQNYTCLNTTPADAGTDADGSAVMTYTWTLTGPAATLADCTGATIGAHFASSAGAAAPEWITTADGSAVIAQRDGTQTAIDPTGVPWLRLRATTHVGTGTLSRVDYVQRVNTHGGRAPATGCDAAHVGMMLNVPYTADYYFWGH